MMKILLGVTALVMLLAGCVAVPVYSEPVPAYGYYGPPPVTFSFGFNSYRGGRSHGRGHGHGRGRGYRR